MTLRLGTRGSALARAQSAAIAGALNAVARAQRIDIDVELHIVTAVREALIAGDCDLAVHALTDVPMGPYEGLTLAAVPIREDSRDALCSGGVALRDLPQGARIGTGSPRRIGQLLVLRPDLEVVPVGGTVDARLEMVGDSLDGLVLAVAGLKRLGRLDAVSEIFAYDAMAPAPGQGALAIETRSDAGADLAAVVALLDDHTTRAATTAEREALRVLESGCSAPVGAHASIDKGILTLMVRVTNATGTLQLNETNRGPVQEAERIGRLTAHSLLGRGAAHLMECP